MTKAALVTLGCPKNVVDSEFILGQLENTGIEVCEDIKSADIMLLNTCAFIKEAKEESIDLILELAKLKKQGRGKKLVVIGCLVQRYLDELQKELPEVDRFITLKDLPNISTLLKNLKNGKNGCKKESPVPSSFLCNNTAPRHRLTPRHFAYIKIADGCSNRCSYCAIPNIKGDYKYRHMDSIIDEAKILTAEGVKEINIIAQDTTNYPDIVSLLRKLCNPEYNGTKWIRLLYTHPAHITDSLIEEIALQDKICKYIDLPLQHIDDDILNRMGRKTDSIYIRKLIEKIRNTIPDVAIRTSFIIGFPGETEEKFQRLLEFMKEIKFERLGIFTYSKEEGTPAYKLPDQISEKIKDERFHKAMQLQNDIAREVNRKFMGKTMEVLVEEPNELDESTCIGRTYADAPDVDGVVYLKGSGFKPGDIIKVKIVDTLDYDLVGIRNEPSE